MDLDHAIYQVLAIAGFGVQRNRLRGWPIQARVWLEWVSWAHPITDYCA